MSQVTGQASPKTALLKRQGQPVTPIDEAVALSDERLEAAFPGCLEGALAVRERFRSNGERIPYDSGNLPKDGQLVVTIVRAALLEVEGVRTAVDDLDDVRTTERIREIAIFMGSWAGQATVDWMAENWIAVIRLIKRAGPKGGDDEILQLLLAGGEHWSPALLLSWRLARLEALGQVSSPDFLEAGLQEEIKEAIAQSEQDIRASYVTFANVKKSLFQPVSVYVPGM